MEWLIIGLIFLMGVVLRAAWPSRLAVEHFDEGVYGSNIFFSGQKGDEQYPDQHLYAPPLVPLLIEFSMLVLGPSNLAAMVVNIVAGSLTIPLLWWVGRRWFGSPAGLASAALVATSDVHIFFSRTALTDVLLCFWFVVALHFISAALTTRDRTAILAAATATGLAWWTKYNGWLPLAVGLAGLLLWRVFDSAGEFRTQKTLRPNWVRHLLMSVRPLARWAMVAVMALLIWVPWLWRLQESGGYAGVVANHRGYIVGVSGWCDSLMSQAGKLRQLDSWMTCATLVTIPLACLLFASRSVHRSTWNRSLPFRCFAIWMLAGSIACLAVGTTGMLAVAAVGGIIANLRRSTAAETPLAEPARQLGNWLLTAWFVGLLVITPLYTPYPRLTLPWLTACWLAAGAAVSAFVQRAEPRAATTQNGMGASLPFALPPPAPPPNSLRRHGLAAGLGLMAIAVSCFARVPMDQVPAWRPRNSLVEKVPRLVDSAYRSAGVARSGDLDQIVIYTYGEPALLFQLRLAGLRWVRAVKDLAVAGEAAPVPRLPSFIVIGPQSRRTPGFTEQFAKARERLTLVDTFSYRASELVNLDRTDWREMHPDERLELYRVK
jgi:4-amino-4-deoxy-L-arabinose transferase-like glycosyltransferase